MLVLCFDPNLGTTRQRLVWRIDDSARPVDRYLRCVLVALVRLHRQHWISSIFLDVGSDLVLVYVNYGFQFDALSRPIIPAC